MSLEEPLLRETAGAGLGSRTPLHALRIEEESMDVTPAQGLPGSSDGDELVLRRLSHG